MSKPTVQEQFGPNAANYVTSPVHAKGASLQRLVALTAPKPDWSVLDIATGAGHTALTFAPHVASVIASDVTAEMLREAETLAKARGLSNVTCQTADAMALPFEAGAFDLVTCRIAPHHFPDIPAFVAEVARVLKAGGTFALVDNLSPDAATSPAYDPDALAEARDLHNAFEAERDPSHARALSQSEWIAAVEGAGLRVRHTEHLAKTMNLKLWCDTLSVSDATRRSLRGRLEAATPALRAFLKPTLGVADDDSDTTFELTELLLIADKA